MTSNTNVLSFPNRPSPKRIGSAVPPRATSLPLALGNRAIRRAIKKVLDSRGEEAALLPVGAVLDGLTSQGLTALRRQIAHAKLESTILFRCGNCNAPVYLTGNKLNSTGDGRSAYFAHRSHTPAACDWRTPDVLRSTGSQQFNGNQEGETHERLKHCLADSLRCDPDFSEPLVEKRIVTGFAPPRIPDVFSHFKGQPVAFEIQLARLPLVTLTERTAFYARAGIKLVWVTSAHELAALNAQAFRDIYFGAGGRIFAVDAASYERSEETSTFHLRELSLEPCIQHPFAIYNRWRDRMVGPDVILMPDAQRHAEGQRAYATALAEQLQARAPHLPEKIRNAIAASTDLNSVATEWSALAKVIGARDLRQAIQDELPRVLRWLLTVERLNNSSGEGRETVGKFVAARAAAIVASRTGKHWVPLLEHVGDAVPAVKAVFTRDLRTAMIRRKASDGRLHPFHIYHRHMISALHPWLAFWLLAKAPNGKAPHKRLP